MFRRNFLVSLLAAPFTSLFSKGSTPKEPPFMLPEDIKRVKERVVVFRHYSPYQFEDMGCKLGIAAVEPIWAEPLCRAHGEPSDVIDGQAKIRKIERMIVRDCWLALNQPMFFRSENPADEEHLWAGRVTLVRDTITLATGERFNSYSLRRVFPSKKSPGTVPVCKTFT